MLSAYHRQLVLILQEMRTYKEAEAAGKHVGFELVNSIDIATASPVAGPWCENSLHTLLLSVLSVLMHICLLFVWFMQWAAGLVVALSCQCVHVFRYGRLKWLRDSHLITVNRALVSVVSALHIAPHGMHDVHEMLVKVSLSLVQGGESGVFSPMHLLLFKKPGATSKKQ